MQEDCQTLGALREAGDVLATLSSLKAEDKVKMMVEFIEDKTMEKAQDLQGR